MELLVCLVVHPPLLLRSLGYGASFASFWPENPRLPALPVGTGMPSPSISQESATSITCLLDCRGRKGLRGGTEAVAKLSFHGSKRASGGREPVSAVAREGGCCSCTCWEESKEDLLLQQFLPHTLCLLPSRLSAGGLWQPSSVPTSTGRRGKMLPLWAVLQCLCLKLALIFVMGIKNN